jgi:hypothetical protein
VIRSNMSARKCSMCSWVIEVTTVGMPRWTKAWKFQAHVKYESTAQAADRVHGARSASPEAEFPDRGMCSTGVAQRLTQPQYSPVEAGLEPLSMCVSRAGGTRTRDPGIMSPLL